MRQIKFRAWCESNKEMYYPDGIYEFCIDNNSIGFYPRYDKDELHHFNTNPSESEKEILVMQFSGLHDKNGKEIYEGDIVKQEKWVSVGNYEQAIGVVKYKMREFTVECYGDWLGSNADLNCNAEVIGNIFENKNLLP